MHTFLLAAALANPQADTSSILKAIDNICGDTWCEGDYSFRFHKVALDSRKNRTQLFFTMSYNYPTELEGGATILKQSFDVSCEVAGYSTLETIMENKDQLNWNFYTSLTDCIQTLEGRLGKVNRVEP